MAKTLPVSEILSHGSAAERGLGAAATAHTDELSKRLLWLIGVRAVILFLALNLADPLGILPSRLGPFPSLPFFNLLTISLTISYLALWWTNRWLAPQVYLQIGVDLFLTTALVAHTRGVESAFVSFYLLIIIYCSVLVGRSGAKLTAALSAILYSALIVAEHLASPAGSGTGMALKPIGYRVAAHAFGFFAVAFLGIHLSERLHAVQKELEEKIDSLRQLQRLNEHVVSSIRSGLVTTDLHGQIAVFNSAAEELTERRSGQALFTPVQSIFGNELWSKITSTDLFQNARPLRHEDWILLPSGARRFIGFSVSPLVDHGHELLGYILSFQDLTDIKRLEEEIRVKDRMAAVGRMASGIAHEIRNPLTSMRGSVELLRSRVMLPKAEARLLDILIRESDRLNKFVEDFLLFARPGKYARREMDLVPLLKDSVTLLQNNPDVTKKHSVLLRIQAAQIPVFANPDQLRQVFWNITQNGLRAMPDGGTLTISARKPVEGGARVIFEDQGVGMTREDQQQLFQPFHAGFAGGTGLGLSITFQILQDHQGSISIDSEKGHGTRVMVSLPPEGHAASDTRVH